MSYDFSVHATWEPLIRTELHLSWGAQWRQTVSVERDSCADGKSYKVLLQPHENSAIVRLALTGHIRDLSITNIHVGLYSMMASQERIDALKLSGGKAWKNETLLIRSPAKSEAFEGDGMLLNFWVEVGNAFTIDLRSEALK